MDDMEKRLDIPTVATILDLIESQYGPDVEKALRGRVRSGLSYAWEDFPSTFPERLTLEQEIVAQWIRQSDLEFKPQALLRVQSDGSES